MAEVVTKRVVTHRNAQKIARQVFRHENFTLVLILLAIMGGFSVITGRSVFTRLNLTNIAMQSTMRGLAALGQTFVILTAGIDISVGGLALACACLGSGVMTTALNQNIVGTPLPIIVGVLIMLLLGVGIGALNGTLVAKIGMPALIVTLGMWRVTIGIGFQLTHGNPFIFLPEGLSVFAAGDILGVPVAVILFVVAVVISYMVLHHTTFGRNIYAVGGNPVSAWLTGINVKGVKLAVYMISGFTAALASVIVVSRAMSASLQTAEGLELDTIAAVSIGGVSLAGGRGTIIGAVIGTFILGAVNNGMNIMGTDPAIRDLIKGTIIIVAVMIDCLRRR
jgi:ribose transport system permease protein